MVDKPQLATLTGGTNSPSSSFPSFQHLETSTGTHGAEKNHREPNGLSAVISSIHPTCITFSASLWLLPYLYHIFWFPPVVSNKLKMLLAHAACSLPLRVCDRHIIQHLQSWQCGNHEFPVVILITDW